MGSNVVNSALSIPLVKVKTREIVGYLDYEYIELKNTQKRLVERKALQPKLHLADYTTKAVIDWIEIRIFLNRKTQLQWLQRITKIVLKKTILIKNSLKLPNDPDDVFTLCIQEPDTRTRARLTPKWQRGEIL